MLIQDTGLIKPEQIELYNKLGIVTVEDAILFFPRTYEDRRNYIELRDVEFEDPCVVYGEISNTHWITTKKKKTIFEAVIEDDDGNKLALQWFSCSKAQAGFIQSQGHIMAFGEPKFRKFMITMMNPEFSVFATPEKPGLDFMKIVPVYSLTNGIRQYEIRKVIYKILSKYLHTETQSYIPKNLGDEYHLPDIYTSLKEVHFPKCASLERLIKCNTPFHKRVIFEELFIKSLCIEVSKQQQRGDTIPVTPDHVLYSNTIERFYENTGFRPTQSQVYVIGECIKEIDSGKPVRIVINGDVGTGKTTVAFDVATYITCCGMQTAIMAPTEILAQQHFNNAKKYFNNTNIVVDMIVGGMSAKTRKEAITKLLDGTTNIIIGTHAIIQKDIEFKHLGMCIIDEQHKFGAIQRTILTNKGKNVHIIQMSATPIPRTIQMTLYGNMRVLSLDRIPGKAPAITKVFANHQRRKLYTFMKQHVTMGNQVYVVYPLVEDSEHVDLNSATTMSQEIQKTFPDFTVGLVHGRLKQSEKDKIMQSFKQGDIDILVSTTVIEVGVDVHNATMMVIEHAERFGLSQLHQLRGRVGRGKKESFCVLVTHGRLNDVAKKRIEAMLETTNGFIIAERDLAIRGPGDYFGTEQSGFTSSFRMADLMRDVKALEYARNDARTFLEHDPDLKKYPHIKNKIVELNQDVYI